ncbi:MAG: aldehyde ferredoxin oxidoreductase C-terminal domain-containing protein [Dehalococcoidia bacterium]|jgi:aldehyde:ferredoxin oxidoreductase|nr:aldehyde ferredoxin oxidoreductase C-terminal domain-containing protein [Dehalococcoidia bacterium]
MSFPYGGYTGRLLRVNLTTAEMAMEDLDPDVCRNFIGGPGIAARILFHEVPPFVDSFDPRNRLIIATGPLTGTGVEGAVTASVVTVSTLSNGAVATNMNGTLALKMKECGYDAVILQGTSLRWVYLHIDEQGQARLLDANDLLGMDTLQTEEVLRTRHGDRALRRRDATVSVACIGPAGENMVRFAGLYGCQGHSASKGGSGAVLGSKRVKAIVIGPPQQGGSVAQISYPERMEELLKSWRFNQRRKGMGAHTSLHGWFGLTHQNQTLGIPPIKNLTSTDFETWYANYTEDAIRSLFDETPDQCPTCDFNHCNQWRFKEGRHKGQIAEEPEYDTVAAFGPNLGINDPQETVYLAGVADRLGLEYSELTFSIGLLMECYEMGLISDGDLDGEPLHWGDIDGVERLMKKIAHRRGCGDRFAGGAWRTAQEIGGQALDLAVVNKKGHTPQVHDNRTSQLFHFGEIVSEVGHYQSLAFLKLPGRNVAGLQAASGLGMPQDLRRRSMFQAAPDILPAYMFITQLHDLLGTCVGHSSGQTIEELAHMLDAVTGMGTSPKETLRCSQRYINLLRVFNISRGLDAATDDTTAKLKMASGRQPYPDKPFGRYFPMWKRRYYFNMGWDGKGVPRIQTLRRLGLAYALDRLPKSQRRPRRVKPQ